MGSRGPARTPTQILKLRGSWLANRREGEPKGDPAAPHCPKWLRKEGKALWKEIVPQLAAMGVLARCDRNAIARYCQTFAKWREAEEFLKEHGAVYPEKDASGARQDLAVQTGGHAKNQFRQTLAHHRFLFHRDSPFICAPSRYVFRLVSNDGGP